MGLPLYTPRDTRGVQRPRTWSPQGEGRYAWAVGPYHVSVLWRRREGYSFLSCWDARPGVPFQRLVLPDVERGTVKKPNVSAPAGQPGDDPPAVSTFLKRYPRLLAFLTDRWYDDGSPRWPGSVWIDSDLSAAKALLKEPTLCLCARIRAAALDDLMSAIEVFLGLDSPPWEHDRYAAEAAVKKKRK
jgi:hypothetical protein